MEANDWQRAMALLTQGRQALARLGKQGSLEDAWLLKYPSFAINSCRDRVIDRV